MGRDIVAEIWSRPGPGRYEGKFEHWDERASVRTKPQRSLRRADGQGQMFFPPESLPVLTHPAVAARGTQTRDRLLVHALYQYLRFTTVLEQTRVLPVTAQISAGLSGVSLPAAMRRDAFRITTDEAWHSQFSHDFLSEVVQATGISPAGLVEPCFAGHLTEVRDSFEPSMLALADLFFVIVSETLISGLLAGIPSDKRLPPAVRAVIGDHAEDEGRHHAYFRSFLGLMWPRMSPGERRLIGPKVPELAAIFLRPDRNAITHMLAATGFSAAEADGIVAECCPHGGQEWVAGPAARGTICAFRDVGAFDDDLIYDTFAAAGLLEEVEHAAAGQRRS
jgi:P-aminobenzoate N-oxygenase AurF